MGDFHPHNYGNGWSFAVKNGNTYYYDPKGMERCGENIGSDNNPSPCMSFPMINDCRCSRHTIKPAEIGTSPTMAYMSQFFPSEHQYMLGQAFNPLNRDIGGDIAIYEYRKAMLLQVIFSNEYTPFAELMQVNAELGVALNDNDFVQAFNSWKRLNEILVQGQQGEEAWKQVFDVMELKRKASQTESTTMANSAKVITYERVTTLLMRILGAFVESNSYDDASTRRRRFEQVLRGILENISG